MKIENQVCSLESVQELAALGVTVESYFKHMNNVVTEAVMVMPAHLCPMDTVIAPAHTVGELLEATKKWNTGIKICGGTWTASMSRASTPDRNGFVIGHRADTPQDALALCLCGAIAQGHITVEELSDEG